MLRELLGIFRADDPLSEMARKFRAMLDLAHDLTIRAGDIFFSERAATPEERTAIYKQDVKINKLERKIRKRVIAHLTLGSNAANVPYCLLLMSLVKDVERLGDYAKNLAELDELYAEPLPDDDVISELRELRLVVELAFRETSEVFESSDHDAAAVLIRQLRDVTTRCDNLVNRIARGSYQADLAAATVLGTRYYKRFAAHLLNVLSSVVMPLHKLDYYDERMLPDAPDDRDDS